MPIWLNHLIVLILRTKGHMTLSSDDLQHHWSSGLEFFWRWGGSGGRRGAGKQHVAELIQLVCMF